MSERVDPDALAGPTAQAARAALAERAGVELCALLDDLLGERLRRVAKRPRDGAGWVDVSAHDLSDPWPPPSTGSDRDGFVMSASTVAGAVGRLALRERGEGEPVGVAVARVLASLEVADRDAVWFADWYTDELDRTGRAAVVAASTTWATGALSAVHGRDLVWATRRQSFDVPDRTIRLRANWDASDRVARPEVLLVMSRRAPSDPAAGFVAGFNGLVDGLLRHQVPARVRVGSASTASTVPFTIDREALEAVVERVVEVVRSRIEAAEPRTENV